MSPNKRAHTGWDKKGEEKEEEEEEEKEEGGAKQRYGILKFCMDCSMILYKTLLGYGLLEFSLDISFDPFLGFC